ncbi:MAG: sulfite exporter TauE/SafE family protein [Acidobacteria bacterium]|nr:sulfite exporter TauE/SafE family protein [Acidobacteriota bacterium]
MELLFVSLAALVVAALTLYSGFGLGTLLMPVFALFFPLEVAVGVTAIVHLLNNLFKVWLVGKDVSWPVALRFGLPAIPAAYFGAALLAGMSERHVVAQYTLGSRPFEVTTIGLVMGILIGVFSLLDLLPVFDRIEFSNRLVPAGGALSGFFGGLSGHQGALRSAFLVNAGLSKEALIATGVVCSVAVDVTRLAVYSAAVIGAQTRDLLAGDGLRLLVTATLAAFLGSYFGARLLAKVTMTLVRRLVGAMLLLLALAIGAGWI